MTKDHSWMASQIVYEIFPDRFAIGKMHTPKEKLALACYRRANDYVTRDWNDLPDPSKGSKEFFGGDLYGVIDRLDYLQHKGITTLFLTPIFFAPSNHKYDATDFFEVDEQFGGEQALVKLIEQLHRRKMHLILDISFNHISDVHPWFIAAVRNEQPFKDFFIPSSEFLENEFEYVSSTEFALTEFKNELSIKKLCTALEKDTSILHLPPMEKRVDWLKIDRLNTLIGNPELYDQLSKTEKFKSLQGEIRNHIKELKNARDKTKNEKNIKKLNRYLLETLYRHETPRLRDRLSIEKLCKRIEDDIDGIGLSSAEKTVEWLNELIRRPELYDGITRKKNITTLDESIKKAIDKLKKKYDLSKSKDDLKQLNRHLLESFYPRETPMSYQCWHGYRPMPELNLTNKKLQGILFRDDKSVLQKYLRLGVDGFRFDAANDLGLGVIRDIRRALKDKFPHTIFIGEVTNYGGDWIDEENGYHGVMNYYFYGVLYSWLFGDISSLQMNYTVNEYCLGYGKIGSVCSWNILSSHDTPRLKSMLTEEAARTLAVVIQFTLPGVPFIYYGEEVGMEGGPDPDCRRPMWDETRWNKATLKLYETLSDIRKSRAELREGSFMMLGHKMMSDALAFLRYTEKINEVSIVVINRSSKSLKEKLFIPHSYLFHKLRLKDLLFSGQTFEVQVGGNIDLEIPGRSALILVPDDTQFVDYKFYKLRNLSDRQTSVLEPEVKKEASSHRRHL